MSVLSNLITNRRSDEATYAADLNKRDWADMFQPEKVMFAQGRGAYRHTDLNRVGEACAEINEIANRYNFAIPNYTALRTDWAEGERPTPAQLTAYIGTVNAIKTAFGGTTPLPANMRHMTVDDANNIEKLLAEVADMMERMIAIFVRSGEYNSGAVLYPAEGDLELKGCICFYIPVEYDYYEEYYVEDMDGNRVSAFYDTFEEAEEERQRLDPYHQLGYSVDFHTYRVQRSFTLSSTKNWDGTLEYSRDKDTWQTWDGTEIRGSKIFLRGTGNTKLTSGSLATQFILTGANISVIGNIENLLDYQTVAHGENPTMAAFCFRAMFYNQTALVSAARLIFPVTTLVRYCYGSFFDGCSNLIEAPAVLPTTTLVDSCYRQMFYRCTSLIMPPKILANTTEYYCCFNMFRTCTSLVAAPKLYALELAERCYSAMFQGCDKIKIRSTSLGYEDGYDYTWRVPIEGTGILGTNSLSGMFSSPTGSTVTPAINREYYATFPSI